MPRSTRRVGAASFMISAAIVCCAPPALQSQAPHYREGEAVVVATEGAPLQVGSDVRARLRRGEPLRVVGVRQDWIWTSVERDGREIKGWVYARHVRSQPPPRSGAAPAPEPRRADPEARLQRLGARLQRNEAGEIVAIDFQGKRVAPAVLADLRQLGALRSLSLAYCSGISDDSLRVLEGIPSLESLDLTFCSDVTDAGLEHVQDLTNLKRLNLSGTAITDAGLAHLSGLAALEELDLSGSLIRRGAIDGSGLSHVKDLSKLRRLSLYNTLVEDAGLARLEGLTSLEALNLGDTWITADGLTRLQSLNGLRELRLAYCDAIDDSSLEALPKLPQLEDLDLTFCRITDAAAERLASIAKLRRLVLTGTRVTESGQAQLAAALPDCKIER